mgnify:CR=1 FL=1
MKARTALALLLNSLIIMGEAVAIHISFNAAGWSLVQYYTFLSNILLLVSSLVYLSCGGKGGMFTRRLRMAATVCVTLTFLVTAALLAPAAGATGYHDMMLSGDGLYYHLLCPLISILSFLCFEDGSGLRRGDAVFPFAFTLLYALVTTVLNIMHLLYGPYFFLHVYEQSVPMSIMWFILIPGAVWLMALLFIRLCHKEENRWA